jgi:hypothetical protein
MRRKGMSKELLEQVSKEKLVDALMEQKRENEELQKVLTEVQSKGKKATEGELDDLQGVLANVMAAQVEYTEAVVTFDMEGNEVVSEEKQYTASPALLGTILKFLKDNNITTDISTNENTETLQKAMSRKKKRSDTRLPKGDKIVDLLQQS